MISIIIPVFNAGEYIEKCVKSIQRQTVADWELILVDDGSVDGSGEICDRLAVQDHRFRVVHQRNRGVSAARNAGLQLAKGEYVTFVDADDWAEPDLCEQMLSHMGNSDLVISGYYFIEYSGKQKNAFSGKLMQISLREELHEYFDELYMKGLLNSPFSKMYKRSLLGNQVFNRHVALGEDLLFNLEYYLKCSKITVLPYAGYNYNRLNENSATRKLRMTDFSRVLELYDCVKAFQKKLDGDWSDCIAAERICCMNEINLLQLLMDSELDLKEKKGLSAFVFGNQEFVYCAEHCGKLPAKLEIPRRICLWKSYFGLKIFFTIKRWMKQMLK